jgi:glyoxylase-like metal-dependent hydrolase (beta-lactamase superfamily II)
MSMDGIETPAAAPAALTYPLGEPPGAGDLREVAPGVLWLRMPLPFVLRWINLWLIEDGEGWTAVDTGVGIDETREHWGSVLAHSALGGRPITRVIVTHMHPDHIGMAGWLTRKYDCPLWISRLEYIQCRMLAADTGLEAPEDGVRFYRAAGWNDEAIDSYKVRFGGFGRVISRLPDSFHRINDDDEIAIGDRIWRVITGCGHSPDHVCLFQPELNLFISGDQLLPRISSNVSVFPTEPDADPLTDWLDSCAKLRAALPADVLTLPAHNEPFIGAHERLTALIDGHERGLDRLEARLREQPRHVIDVFGALFARKIDAGLLGMATGETVAHLNCLIRRGRATRTPGKDGVALYAAD